LVRWLVLQIEKHQVNDKYSIDNTKGWLLLFILPYFDSLLNAHRLMMMMMMMMVTWILTDLLA